MTVSVYSKAMALYNEKKYVEALSAFRNSLELGNDKSAYGLALCMKLGNGMFVDERSAKLLIDGYLERIEKCAREGDSEAQQVMGCITPTGCLPLSTGKRPLSGWKSPPPRATNIPAAVLKN